VKWLTFHERVIEELRRPGQRAASSGATTTPRRDTLCGRFSLGVRIDGKPPGAAHGWDVDGQGMGTVAEQRLYQFVRQPTPVAERQFEIEFFDPGVAVYVFTFG
jgi:Thioredoxin like C-terminal domain